MAGGRHEVALLALLGAASLAVVGFFLADSAPERPPQEEWRLEPPPDVSTTMEVEEEPAPKVVPDPAPVESEPEVQAESEPEAEPEPEPAVREEDKPARLILEFLEPVEEPDRRVIATVVDGQGNPLIDVLVVVRDAGEIIYRSRTGENGRAEFVPYAQERGPWELTALAHGFEPGGALGVLPGADVTIPMDLTPSIEGDVRGPVQGRGFVELVTEHTKYKVPIQPDGTYFFPDLPEGEAVLHAAAPPYRSREERVLLRRGQREYVRLRLRTPKRIRLYGEIDLWPGKGTVTINGVPATVTRSGRFTFDEAVPNATNEIFIDAPRKALMVQRFFIKGGGSFRRVRFRLEREARIRGRVITHDRRRVPGAKVLLGVNFADPRNDRVPYFPVAAVPVVTTDKKGNFEILRLDPRLLYMVTATAPGHARWIGDAVPGGGFLILRVPPSPYVAGKLRGRGGVPRDAVIHAEGQSIVPWRFAASPDDAGPQEALIFNSPDWKRTTTTRDRRGYYRIDGLLPGYYSITGRATGFRSQETVVFLEPGLSVRLDMTLRRGVDNDEDAELLERLPPSEYDPEIDVPPDDWTVLKVDLTRRIDQVPFGQVRVEFFYEELEFRTPLLFDNVEFELTGLPEGKYRAVVMHPTVRVPVIKEGIVLQQGEIAELKLLE